MNNDTQQLPNIFTRAPDSQFDQMDRLLESARSDMETSKERAVDTADIEFFPVSNSIGLSAASVEDGKVFPFLHYSMMQACRMAKLDSDVVRRLRDADRLDLAIDNLNTLFPNRRGDYKIALIDGQDRIRALNGGDYSRLWDHTMFEQINNVLIPNGFTPAVARNGIGALLRPGHTALFRGDQTSFGFFFTDGEEIGENLGNLRQGLMIWNSEVGARSFGFSNFYFREMSGTFLLWDRHGERRKRFVHRGDISRGFAEYLNVVQEAAKNANGTRESDIATFNEAAITPFANTDEEAIEKLNKLFDMPKAQAQAVVQASYLPQNASGNPLSVWRISLGIAYEAAQTSRAESLVDDSATATKVIRRMVK